MTSTPLISVQGLAKSYGGVLAISEIDLDIRRGERIAIIGPNGAGKSTLFGTIAGEHRATEGKIMFAGKDVTTWPPSRLTKAGLSRTFQVARLFGSMSVRENLVIAAKATRRNPVVWWDTFTHYETSVAERVDRALGRTSLTDLADQEASTLPQGARKTLELAMAIVQEPQVLLLDEPTAGMSLDDALGTIRTLKEICRDQPDLTVVITAHDMEVIFAVAERVVLMAQGRVVLEGTPQEVTAHDITHEVYLGGQHV
ncbi:ABC transporter ATP-binding protein [Aeromicrobium sp. P5_D10]